MPRIRQRDRNLRLLQERRGEWVPVFEIVALACHCNARLKELREQGYQIENENLHVCGQVHSSYRLVEPKGQRGLFGNLPEQKRESPYPFEWQERHNTV